MKKKGFRLPRRPGGPPKSEAVGTPSGRPADGNDTMQLDLHSPIVTPSPGSLAFPEVTESFDQGLENERSPLWGTALAEEPEAVEDSSEEGPFFPVEAISFEAGGLTPAFVEHLVLKYLLENPGATGNWIAGAVGLKPLPVRALLGTLKRRLLVLHSGGATADFQYELTENGRVRATHLRQICPYTGPAPVTLEHYRQSVRSQSIAREPVQADRLAGAFSDLVLPGEILDTLGPAMTSGRGLFLFGSSGNGKTSIALRMVDAYSSTVFIPHAVWMNGAVVQVFDPQVHQQVENWECPPGVRLDRRWIPCRRPVVVAGGELTMESLDLEPIAPGVCESPLQLKANCGIFLVDDFGRQRVDAREMLNRWIVPLENRVDFLRLPSGRTIQVPFDALLVFSTNLEPRDLVDEAFLRRIPYKVQIPDPTPDSFRLLLTREATALGFEPSERIFNQVIDRFYHQTGRPMRGCHPRDLLLQVRNRCRYLDRPLVLSLEAFDLAARTYFTLL